MDRIPLARPVFSDETVHEIRRVLATGFVTQGPEVARFEKDAAAVLGGGMVTAVSSGSTALYAALKAVGVGRGDQVIVPAFSHPAPAYAAVLAGGIPVPVDADPDTLSLDLAAVGKAITSMTRAIVVVDGLGVPGPVQDVRRIIAGRQIALVEDAACALGATGITLYSDVATFSMHPRKVITSGEGGFLFTRDAYIDAAARRIRNFGLENKGFGPVFQDFGFNFRFNDILAAVARTQLADLDGIRQARGRVVGRYIGLLDKVEGVRLPAGMRSPGQAFQTMAIQTPVPGPRLVKLMARRGVEISATAHDLAQQPFFIGLWRKLGMAFQCPRAAELAEYLVALPLSTVMTESEVETVVTALKEAIDESTRSGD